MIKMKLYILFSLFACELNKQECRLSEKFLNQFSKGVSEKLPPMNSNLFMFFKLDNQNIIKINNLELYNLYSKEYKKKYNFNEFLCFLFNEEIYLKKESLSNANINFQDIKPNKKIENLNLDLIKNRFCIKVGDYFLLKNSIQDSTRISILYIFFKNKNYVSFDDYSGFYTIRNNLR